jgi:hypothetical protein
VIHHTKKSLDLMQIPNHFRTKLGQDFCPTKLA